MNRFKKIGLAISKTFAPRGFNVYNNVTLRKQLREYAGATMDRQHSNWTLTTSSADNEIRLAFEVLRSRARDLGRNNNNARSYLGELVSGVLGHQGLTLQSIVGDDDPEAVEKFDQINDKIEKEWVIWSRMDSCDVRRRLSLYDIQKLALRTLAESGELPLMQLVPIRRGRSKVKLALNILETDRLDFNFNRQASRNSDGSVNNEIIRGIEIDEFGAHVAYHVFNHHPGSLDRGAPQKRIRIPRRDVLFDFIPERPEQSRGVTWFASTLVTFKHIQEYWDAMLLRKKLEAAIMFFVKKKSPDLDATPEDPKLLAKKEVAETDIDVEGGAVYNLNENEDIQTTDIASNPSADAPFFENGLQQAASGLNASFTALSKNYTKHNYTSIRASQMSERDAYRIIQTWLKEHLLQPLFERWMEEAWFSEVFDFSDFYENPGKYDQPNWMSRGYDHTDPYKDALGEKEELAAGLMTLAEAHASRGKDFRKMVRSLSRERKMLEKYGVEVDYLNDLKKEVKTELLNEGAQDESKDKTSPAT